MTRRLPLALSLATSIETSTNCQASSSKRHCMSSRSLGFCYKWTRKFPNSRRRERQFNRRQHIFHNKAVPGMSTSSVYPPASSSAWGLFGFQSRRSVVHSSKGIVASTSPLACQAGLRILEKGGNAADAAVAVAAALNVTEPTSTGIGGDAFLLYWNNSAKKITALNGSGRSPSALTRQLVVDTEGVSTGKLPWRSIHAINVPGAAAAWVDTVDKLGSGKVSLAEVLAPAIELAEKGYPVTEVTAQMWAIGQEWLLEASPNGAEMLVPPSKEGEKPHAPAAGEIMIMKNLAETFRTLGREGRKGFYEGRIADEIVKVVQARGGVLTLGDLKRHGEVGAEVVEPISMFVERLGVELWECPPNGQGIVALMALGILEALEKSKAIPKVEELGHNSVEYLHALVEALRIAFADASWYITDPTMLKVKTSQLLDKTYLAERAKLFDPKKAATNLDHGSPAFSSSDTVYFCATDKDGNGCSFINSNFSGFGSSVVPYGCGFTLHNRGANFHLDAGHPNVVAGNKRSYHTIIPAMVTQNGELHTVYGVMGGYMQPQGHVQTLLNMLAFGFTPQAALDAPRFCLGGMALDNSLLIEEGIPEETVETLRKMGHKGTRIVKGFEREVFGRGQAIRVHYDKGLRVHSAGSDMRGDGHAVPLL
ncbi:Gamma-glutamyltranspeptidase [Drechslerella dactyloides]|uniref:Gamma-glutamyltranspeptidase n=1 Tax=Drechslerella dactyloides TaxID=74499 RepID=A0AAD6ISV3_DREDA|nr:Gamma-glutamyltranspeptidase [Drechslerella dactyloides]